MSVFVHKAPDGRLQQVIEIRVHRLISDENSSLGGTDAGPNPHDLLDASLAACTALTVTLYAQRKGIALRDVRVSIEHEKMTDAYKLRRRIELIGDLTEAQRNRVLEIANRCPIHQVLTSKIEIDTSLV